MAFSIFHISNDELHKLYEDIIKNNETYAPVEHSGDYKFKKVNSLKECNTDAPIKTTASVKPLFFPQTSAIMHYSEDAKGIKIDDPKEDVLTHKKVILGVKHCDARGMQVLDSVAKWDWQDEDWIKRRENTVIFSTLCVTPENTCFCTSLDYDVKTTDAYDVLVVNDGQKKLLKVCTEKGEQFLEPYTGVLTKLNGEGDAKLKAEFTKFKNAFHLKMDYKEVNAKLQGAFENDGWDFESARCVSCSACAFVCPTCHCFKISDEKVRDKGVRYKSYDSCNQKYFTLMAGGHNPRTQKYRRWRQRGMHKFVYYKERFGVNLCVGCGRCTVKCPVNISIFEVVNNVANNI